MGCVGYVGQNIFYMGHNFYVGCVGQIYFCVSQFFLRDSKTFACVNFYLLERLCYYTTVSLDNYFANLFPTNVDQTLFDFFIIFE